MKTITKNITFAALLSAIAYLLTAFAAIPYAGGAGYLNFGDAVIIFSSMILGPWWGALVGAIAGSLADLSAGYISFALFTLVAKACEAIIAGLFFKYIKNNLKYIGTILGALFMVATYFVAYLILYGVGGLISSAFDLIQDTVGVVFSIILYQLYIKIYKPNANSAS